LNYERVNVERGGINYERMNYEGGTLNYERGATLNYEQVNGKALSLNNFVFAFGKLHIALFARRQSTENERKNGRKNLPKATKKALEC
jgi:hypothetical protein